jgi:hypothetical protein
MSDGESPVRHPAPKVPQGPPTRRNRPKRTPAQEALIREFGLGRKRVDEGPRVRKIGLSPIEARLGGILSGMGLAAWPRFPLGGFELDFALKGYLLDIEADGELYHSSLMAASKRDRKDAWLESRGYKIVHLTGSVVMTDHPLAIRLIREAAAGAIPRPKTTVSSLEPLTLATLEATVSRLKSIREVELPSGVRTKVRNGKLRDETGELPLVLWGDEVDLVSVGDQIRLVDAWVSDYMGHRQVTPGKRGRIEIIAPKAVSQRDSKSGGQTHLG